MGQVKKEKEKEKVKDQDRIRGKEDKRQRGIYKEFEQERHSTQRKKRQTERKKDRRVWPPEESERKWRGICKESQCKAVSLNGMCNREHVQKYQETMHVRLHIEEMHSVSFPGASDDRKCSALTPL